MESLAALGERMGAEPERSWIAGSPVPPAIGPAGNTLPAVKVPNESVIEPRGPGRPEPK